MTQDDDTTLGGVMAENFLVRPSVGSAIARPRTFLNIVIDESSSMGDVREATINAFNTFIESQRHDRVDELFVTLTKFSSRGKVRVVYTALPIAQVPLLTYQTYRPDGMTALYDGVNRTLVSMEEKVGLNARVLTVVITDGHDNESREVKDAAHLKRILDALQARGNWTFVFLAAGVDAYAAGADMGFPSGNVQVFTVENVTEALATVGRGVTGYRHSDKMQTDDFFRAPKFRRTQWTQDAEPEKE